VDVDADMNSCRVVAADIKVEKWGASR
jgi:hypothetical protein